MINGLGLDWIKEFNNLLEHKFSTKKFKLFVDCKKNYGLFINLVEQKIDYLKVDAEKETFKRLNQIAKKNMVSLNPKINDFGHADIRSSRLSDIQASTIDSTIS